MSHLITHPLRRAAALAVAVAGVCLLGACADDPVTSPAQPGTGDSIDPDTPVTSSPGDTGSPSSPAPSGPPVPADLTVSLDDGSGNTSAFTLTCMPDGGTHPDAATACGALAAAGAEAFGPPPKDMACTELYGGPETATVKGTVDGQPVSAEFSRTDGCQIGRWELLAALFAGVGGADS